VSGQPVDRRSCTAVAKYRQYPGAVPCTAPEYGLKEHGVALESVMIETQWRDEVVAAAVAVASSYMHIPRSSHTDSTQAVGALSSPARSFRSQWMSCSLGLAPLAKGLLLAVQKRTWGVSYNRTESRNQNLHSRWIDQAIDRSVPTRSCVGVLSKVQLYVLCTLRVIGDTCAWVLIPSVARTRALAVRLSSLLLKFLLLRSLRRRV
jgi:hypothetical protein